MKQFPILYDVILPNYALPNAIITELGIVNYLHSLNYPKASNFFDQNLKTGSDSVNPLTLLFNDSLSVYPNATGGSGTHLQAGWCSEIVKCIEDSLFLGKQKYNRYIYPVRVSPYLDDFCGYSAPGRKINGEYFWKHMSVDALADAREGRAIVLLDFAQENFIEKRSYVNLHRCLEQSGIPKSNVVLYFNTFNAEELYNSWFSPEEQRLEVKSWPFVLCNTSWYYSQQIEARLNTDQFFSTKDKIRKNAFLFKIRRPREHRKILLYRLNDDNLLSRGDWSWLTNEKFDEGLVRSILNSFQTQLDVDKIKSLYDTFPHMLQDEPTDSFDTISSWTDHQTKSYENSYFYICTETYTHGEQQSITEKVCKPMANFMPFLFVSFPGALKLLRDLGFKTFSGFIDESYDTEPDVSRRTSLIYNEIKRLCSMTQEELHEWYWKMEDILLHNYETLLKYYQNDRYTANLVNYLDNKLNGI